jgi:hypothetical protein
VTSVVAATPYAIAITSPTGGPVELDIEAATLPVDPPVNPPVDPPTNPVVPAKKKKCKGKKAKRSKKCRKKKRR